MRRVVVAILTGFILAGISPLNRLRWETTFVFPLETKFGRRPLFALDGALLLALPLLLTFAKFEAPTEITLFFFSYHQQSLHSLSYWQ